MLRAGFLVLALLVIGMVAPATADESRGYAPYDGWFRGGSSYHGFSWRDPKVAGTDARRPDYTLWSGFDKSDLRLKYPLYRDPVHPVHRVARPAGTSYVSPNRTDIQLCARGVPAISDHCPAHHHRGTCCRSACAAKNPLAPPPAAKPGPCPEPRDIPQGD